MNSRTQAIYDYLLAYKREHQGNTPSVRDICEALGISSTSVVAYHLAALERAGRISFQGERVAGAPLHIEIPGAVWLQHDPNIAYKNPDLPVAAGVDWAAPDWVAPDLKGIVDDLD